MQSIAELLRSRASGTPDRGYVWLSQGEEVAARLTYADLDRRARAIAAALSAVPPGERALLLYPPGLEFVAAYFGCLYAGVIAVPAYPPRSRRPDPRLQSIAVDCSPRVVLTTAALLERREAIAQQVPELAPALWLDTEALLAGDPGAAWVPRPDRPADIAFLQYTSGSTGTPKGVVVTHGNLLHNLEQIRVAFGQTAESVVVGWLPLFHDMGLIGNVLQPCFVGCDCVLMAPAAFLQKPARWLEAIHRFRGTTSGGPNFAYDLCARSIGPEVRDGLDLSSWSVAFNGAEPVRRATLDRFAETFAPCGFRRASFVPCYGLAEATLLVTAARGVTDEPQVSCGALPSGDEVRIVQPESGVLCSGDEVGEIWISGPSVARGYWNRPEETRETFTAVTREGGGPFLRTGDLGFVRQGELVVTGRLKDLIILRGRNLYPQDLELTAEQSHPSLRAGSGAAFAVEERGEESLVVVHEVERHAGDLSAIADAVRRAVAEEHGVRVADVVLLRTGTIPKTSSGKIRRRECRWRYLGGDLEVVHRSRRSRDTVDTAARLLTRFDLLALDPPERAAALQAWLRGEIARRAGVAAEGIDPQTTLAAAGLDSLALFDLQARLEADLGLALVAASLAELSVAALADRLLDHLAETPEALEALEPGSADLPPLVPGEVLGDHPLSPGQEALWLLEPSAAADAADGAEGVFHIAAAARLGTAVDSAALLRAALALSARHPALRTTFAVSAAGEPRQQVHASQPPDLGEVEATAWSPRELDAALRREARRRFDLAAGPPLRLRVFARPCGERVLLLVLHHLVGDFWSAAVLLRDWADLYARELDPDRPPLPELPAAYTDFVRWQQRRLAGPAGERLERYWLDRLAGAPLTLDLPTDRPRPRVAAHSGALADLRLGPEVSGRARELAHLHGATLFTTLLAAFQALLGRLSGQGDLLVGCATTGRRDRDLAGVVGYFVNPVVLRAALAADPPLAAHLATTRQAVAEALEHRDLPFPQLARRLQPARDPGWPPVFQALFVLQRAAPGQEPGLAAFAVGQAGARVEMGGLALESLRLDRGTSQLDLTLFAAEVGDALVLSCEYDTALFDGVTIGRWLGHLEALLAAATAHPEERLAALPLLGGAERHQLLAEWSDTAAAFPREATVYGLFAEQAALQPTAVAVEQGGEQWTYFELRQRAERFARRLVALGLRPEERVAVVAERSPDLIAALLGILAAGGAYLPLDPAAPPERLAWMLGDAGASLLVASPLASGLALPAGVRLVELAGEEDLAVELPEIPAESLAYVMYTSGSTGTPKGVAVTHRNVVRLVRGADYADLGPEQTWLQYAPVSFDASTLEIWAPLLNGGRLVLFPEGMGSLDDLARVIESHGVTSAWLTAGLFHEMVDGRLEGLRPLRQLLTGGDVVSPEHARRALAAHPGLALIDGYGPTEGTTFTCCHRMTEVAQVGESVPIGRPIGNARVAVLDGSLAPVPVGVWGELYAGGEGLSRGYLDRPEWTAERFVPDPLALAPGERLYRTGDLVRFRADGSLEFFGRIDTQVKLRGFRVELGEIEAALAALPGVREAVVVVREDRSKSARLVAYVAGEVAVESLRRSLRERLPEYIVPAAFVPLAALPLTPNGKVDRKALPTPAEESAEEGWLAPRTPVEEVLAGIWAEVLGVSRVGANDHFFALGGHSLLATRVMARLRRAFGVELPVRALFEAAKLSELAARVETALRSGEGRLAPPLVPRAPSLRQGPLPLSFAQQRLWFLDQLAPGSPLYNIPAALRIEGALDPRVLALALREIVCRHEALRTTFAARDDSPVQTIRSAAGFALPVVDLSGLGEDERAALARASAADEADRPFDLNAENGGPLLRGRLLRLAADDHLALLTVHHIVSDGWSMGILARELTALYAAFSCGGVGRPSPLPELPVQYGDFALWQRAWLTGEVLAAEIAFWRQQLAGLPSRLELPTDRPRPAVQTFRGAARPVRLSAALTRQAQGLGRGEGATLFMVLLAGWEALLARHCGQEDLAVGTPVAGRTHREIEELIGFFVNTLVLRGDVSGEPSFRALLGRVRETALAAHTHQDVPFEMLVQELAPERSLAHTPLFQVMLVLQNAPFESLEIAGLRLRQVSGIRTTAKFDLTLSLEEQDGGLAGTAEYATDLFDAATIDRLVRHFEVLLAGLLAAPDTGVAQVSILTAVERQQIREWNTTPPPRVSDLLHRRFEAQAARTPGAVALIQGEREMTYAELNARANQLGHFLSQRGVAAGTFVGICLERSFELVIALLGTLKAGGCYVPLDPAYPSERWTYTLQDAGIRLLLTEESLLPLLPAPEWEVLCLDRDRDRLATCPTGDPPPASPPASTPEDLLLVIYTSGSTGRPKGAAFCQRSYLNLLDWYREAFDLREDDSFLLISSIAFDLTQKTVFSPLLLGGRLILPLPGPYDPAAHVASIARHAITRLNCTPSTFYPLLDREEDFPRLAALRGLSLGGEPISLARLEPWRRSPWCHAFLLNTYGPTECTDLTSWHRLEPPGERSVVPAGRPLTGAQVWVLSRELVPLPVGVTGQMCAAGIHVTAGYLRQADLTAERFLPNPFSEIPGDRLYRLGDLGRWLPTGELEYLGRVDFQVKLRGIRIEPGEIEAALLALPGVREAAVVAREDRSDLGPGDLRLVAYVVGDATAEALRRSLRGRLPDYMVPAAFVTLARLPLTPSGKVDRKALPAPEWEPAEEVHLPPRTPVEEVLAGIWAEVLGLSRVGANDHFFVLGGHSLLATSVMSRLRGAFGVELPLTDLFAAPRLADLAIRVEAALGAGAGRL
ncbi:MAG TPA: amino acid adenylation domain-containing protein, partial [Thermoanaerobaculia bacterium]|nr:amino acid adenylation domain-containing protein [Thermoanaerobaculia bacterium]